MLSEGPLGFRLFMLIQHKLSPFFLVSVLLLSSAAYAGLDGDYELLSGGNVCPAGPLGFVENHEEDSRALMFGNRHTWPMTMKNRSVVKDAGKNQCTYVWSTNLSRNQFTSKTTRTHCPSVVHNGVVMEKMVLQGKTLTYEFTDKNMHFKCRYRKLSDRGGI